MGKKLPGIVMAAMLPWVAGCSWLPTPQSVADPRAVYAWPLAACPSAPPTMQAAFLPAIAGALAAPLLTDLVSGLVAIPVAAIQAAADADKNGFKASGQNPRFFFPDVTVDPKGSPTQLELTQPGCFVVAFTKFEPTSAAATAQRWCDDPGFAAGVPQACTANGRKLLDRIGGPAGFAGFAPAVPDFYAEITLDDAANFTLAGTKVVRPRVIAAYYPHSLIDPGSSKPRMVTVGLSLTSPASPNPDPMKAATVSVVLQGIRPAPVLGADALVSQQDTWITIPTTTDNLPAHAVPTVGAPFYPVNIATSLAEIGDPSVFLAAFAKAVSGSSADVTKAIVSAVPAIPTAATQQQVATAKASLQKALAQASTDLGKYLAACSPAPTTGSTMATARGLYQTVLADRQAANAAALAIATTPGSGGVSLPFPNIAQDLTVCY